MCGIAGLIGTNRSPEWLVDNARAMATAIAHRGPDADGVWHDAAAGVALAHRRLSILDLSPLGAQPMHSASGRWVITFNGEVFNFAELRAELEGTGAVFRGGSDTEVMLAAIEAWGLDAAVRRFVGMFAFAAWDRHERTLHLVRDRLGIKPLYWARFGDIMLFGSELKSLLAAEGWTPRVDRDALAAYTRWNYVPSPHCIWQGVRKLQPGTRLELRPAREPIIARYWDLRSIAERGVAQPFAGTADEAEAQLHKLLLESVRLRMVSDVPLGAFLSGGVDSSLVVALMQAQASGPVRTFSIGFRESLYDEAVFARAVARHLGTEHTELYVGPSEAIDVIPRLPDMYDEPFADSSQIPTFLVSQMTRTSVTVALSGDGGDELFAGYTRYHWAEMVRRRFLVLPSGVRGMLAGAMSAPPRAMWEALSGLLPKHLRRQRVSERVAKLAAFLREPDADAIYRRQHTHWERPGEVVPGATELRNVTFDDTLRESVPNFVQRMQLLDMLTYLPDDILTKVDRASMAVSLEARVPLLDHRLVEFCWTLPHTLKVGGGVDKRLLRNILYRYVPRTLIERPKMGFALPVGQWLRDELRPWAEDLLSERRLREDGYFQADLVLRTWEAFQAGRNVNQESIWGILMFQAWRARYARFEGVTTRARAA